MIEGGCRDTVPLSGGFSPTPYAIVTTLAAVRQLVLMCAVGEKATMRRPLERCGGAELLRGPPYKSPNDHLKVVVCLRHLSPPMGARVHHGTSGLPHDLRVPGAVERDQKACQTRS